MGCLLSSRPTLGLPHPCSLDLTGLATSCPSPTHYLVVTLILASAPQEVMLESEAQHNAGPAHHDQVTFLGNREPHALSRKSLLQAFAHAAPSAEIPFSTPKSLNPSEKGHKCLEGHWESRAPSSGGMSVTEAWAILNTHQQRLGSLPRLWAPQGQSLCGACLCPGHLCDRAEQAGLKKASLSSSHSLAPPQPGPLN